MYCNPVPHGCRRTWPTLVCAPTRLYAVHLVYYNLSMPSTGMWCLSWWLFISDYYPTRFIVRIFIWTHYVSYIIFCNYDLFSRNTHNIIGRYETYLHYPTSVKQPAVPWLPPPCPELWLYMPYPFTVPPITLLYIIPYIIHVAYIIYNETNN